MGISDIVEVETAVLGLGAVLCLASGRYIYTRMRAASSHNEDFWAFQRKFLFGSSQTVSGWGCG
jgi:hypothetical protein